MDDPPAAIRTLNLSSPAVVVLSMLRSSSIAGESAETGSGPVLASVQVSVPRRAMLGPAGRDHSSEPHVASDSSGRRRSRKLLANFHLFFWIFKQATETFSASTSPSEESPYFNIQVLKKCLIGQEGRKEESAEVHRRTDASHPRPAPRWRESRSGEMA